MIDVSSRILDLCSIKKLRQIDLVELNIGAKQTVNNIFKGKQNPSFEFVLKLLTELPDVNARWLITGEGEMFVKPEKDISNEIVNDPVSEYKNGCKTCRDKQVVIDLLQKQAKEKDEKIYQLQKMVGSLEQLLRGGNDLDRNADIAPTG